MKPRVVITGIGPVTSCGVGVEAFWRNLRAGHCAAKPIPQAWAKTIRSQWYVPLPAVSLAEFGLPPAQEGLLQPEDRMAVTATRLALLDAGVALQEQGHRLRAPDLPTADLILGTGLSGMQPALESFLAHVVPPAALQQFLPDRSFRFNRMVVPKSMPDSPAAWTSILLGLTGAHFTLNASCASGTYAVGEAFRRVQHGLCPVCLAGGVEALRDDDGFIMRGFDILGVLTQAADGRPGPFSRNRSGFLFAEGGACVLVLEELEHARARGARIYAEIDDYRANSDAWNMMQIDPSAVQIRQLVAAIREGQEVDYINAHGTGTIPNDELEARVYQEAFAGAAGLPLVNSTKGILGHTLGASGAIEAAVTALSVAYDEVHPNVLSDPLPGVSLPTQALSAPIRTALSLSFGFGGHNGALRFRKCRL